jgi:hypothetical protein
LARKRVPLLFLGVGASSYKPEFVEKTSRYLKKLKLKPKALFTRDSKAYKNFSDLAEISYDGIDCGFFINEWFAPPKAEQSFVVATFDRIPEPKIDCKEMIIRPHHISFEFPFAGPIKKLWRLIQNKKFQKPGTFFSDNLKDYLFLYANGKETHSDRVHACVPALVYGNPARLYYDTPRAELFKKIKLNGDLRKELTTLDKTYLEREKRKMVSELRKTVQEIVRQ